MEKILLIIIFCVGAVQNYLIARAIGIQSNKRIWIPITGLFIYALVAFICRSISIDLEVFLGVMLSRCLISYVPNSEFRDKLKNFLYLSVFYETTNGVINVVMNTMRTFKKGSAISYLYGMIFGSIVWLIILESAQIYKKRHKERFVKIQFSRTDNIQYWAALCSLVINFAIAGLESLYKRTDKDALKLVIGLTVMFSYISIVILILIIIRTDKINKYLNDTINMEKKMSTMKSEYYEMMLQKEEDTRRYRHDMMNHYICLADLNKNSGNREVSEYLDSLMGKLKKIQEKSVTVGNQTIEILLNYYLSNLPEHIEKSIIGTAPEELDISKPDLCTVFGNILSNASEELIKQEGNNPWLKVEFKEGAMFFCIEVSNSIVEKKLIEDDISVSTEKKDIHNHGFGLRNTDEILRKMEGQLKLECDDEKFVAKIFIKKKK